MSTTVLDLNKHVRAQGAMFWEHTAASSMTLQPSQLPSSMQHFAATHNRCLQRIVWALPKILAFLLVAGATGFGGPMSVLQCVNKPMSLILTVDPPHPCRHPLSVPVVHGAGVPPRQAAAVQAQRAGAAQALRGYPDAEGGRSLLYT
jgi:hypothetical protein